ncbi:unnamed protein product [Clavelina lepadiformis]|uniref:VWFA domain-containing protein n=1 Tax=Clavelina lepadiformis TaxID=159417 RepID=A0ABP0F659_CLALP
MLNLKETRLFLVVVITFFISTSSQNIETRNYISIKPNNAGISSYFGKDIAITSIGNNDNVVYIGAPLMGVSASENEAKPGAMYRCEVIANGWEKITCSNVVNVGETSGAIGMTLSKQPTSLNAVLCGPQYYFSCPNSNVDQRVIGVCYEYYENGDRHLLPSPAPTDCPTGNGELVIDIIFVVDESGSVGTSNFNSGLTWIENVLLGFVDDINDGRVHVGLITFSDFSTLEISLTSRSFAVLRNEMSTIRYSRGITRTDRGINRAIGQFNGAGRSNVPQLMIVITDGKASAPRDLSIAVGTARDAGILMAAVGVGSDSDIDQDELLEIAGSNDRVFRANGFGDLDSILSGLQGVITDSAQQSLEGQISNTTTELTAAQMGMSGHFSETGNLYIGAVGAYDRAGSVFHYRSNNDNLEFVENLDDNDLENLFQLNVSSGLKEAYLGYSVTSGKFFGGSTEYVATGSPRYQLKGVVVIYAKDAFGVRSPLTPLHPASHELWQLGAYFGHSLCSIDLNKDSFDDLLVSAPLYSDATGYDQGRVFVFLNDPTNPGFELGRNPVVLRGSNANEARFGMSVVRAGDIDLNGYEDVIVGAPLEELATGGSGAVYLYLGSEKGLSETNKQRILGSSIASSLHHFGASIANTDVDGNGYTDTAIGAPSSDTVIILRTRPVVDIEVALTILGLPVIDVESCVTNRNQACISFQYCIRGFRRSGGTTGRFDVDVYLDLDSVFSDPTLKRFTFFRETSYSRQDMLSVSFDQTCLTYSAELNIDTLGSLAAGGAFDVTPNVQLSYELNKASTTALLSHVLDPIASHFKSANWNFLTGCSGLNGRCEHDLTVEASFSLPESGTPYVLRPAPGLLSVSVKITNQGPHNSYFTKINITSGALSLSRVTGSCVTVSEEDSTPTVTVLRYAGTTAILNDLMPSGNTCNFTLEFDLASLTSTARSPEISIAGVLYSNAGDSQIAYDENLDNNIFQFNRPVLYDASLSITSSSDPTAVFYRPVAIGNSINSLNDASLGGESTNIKHIHTVYSVGPLRVPDLTMTFSWPKETKQGHPLFYLHDFGCFPSEKCQCYTRNKINVYNLPLRNDTEAVNFPVVVPETNLDNPRPTCEDTACDSITCEVIDLNPFVTITVDASLKVWLPTFYQLPEQYSGPVKMFSEVTFDATDLPLHPQAAFFSNKAETTVSLHVPPIPIESDNSVNIGAIIGGILAGVALLSIAVLVMWKLGFFKSKYRERMRRSIRERDHQYEVIQ